MTSRLDDAFLRLARHRRECRSDECPNCDYADSPEPLSDLDNAWRDSREENTRDHWMEAS